MNSAIDDSSICDIKMVLDHLRLGIFGVLPKAVDDNSQPS